MQIARTLIFLAASHLALGADVSATAGKDRISVTWAADTALKYVTVCSKPGQFNPALVCSGANEDGDVKRTLQPVQSSGTELLTGLSKNKWYTVKVKGIPANGTTRKLIGVVKIKTQKK
jgi:hypothetical protein